MISFLEGNVAFKGGRFCIMVINGIGYKVFATAETLKKIPEKSGGVNHSTSLTVRLWTHQYVREDTVELYGFLQYPELELFETLIGISGIGPKGALGVLAIAPVDTLKKAIASGDTSYLTRVSGIGRKTAEKIVLELKEKMAGRGVMVSAPELKEEADAIEALVSLGYSPRDAREALAKVPQEITGVEKRVKEALKKVGGEK